MTTVFIKKFHCSVYLIKHVLSIKIYTTRHAGCLNNLFIKVRTFHFILSTHSVKIQFWIAQIEGLIEGLKNR